MRVVQRYIIICFLFFLSACGSQNASPRPSDDISSTVATAASCTKVETGQTFFDGSVDTVGAVQRRCSNGTWITVSNQCIDSNGATHQVGATVVENGVTKTCDSSGQLVSSNTSLQQSCYSDNGTIAHGSTVTQSDGVQYICQNGSLIPSNSGSGVPCSTYPGGVMPGMPGSTMPGMPGSTMPGMPGSTMPGMPDSTIPCTTMPGSTMPGSTMPGGIMPGEPMPGGIMPGEPMPGGIMPGEPMPGGIMPGEPMPGGIMSGGGTA